MAIKLINGDAKDFALKADLIFTDPPFDLSGKEVAEIIERYESDHLIMLCTLKQLLEFNQHSSFKLNFDLVIDSVAPKQSKSAQQPFYTHITIVYMTRNKTKSKFNRRLAKRSDVLSGEKGYFPTIIRAPRGARNEDHGMAKNLQAIQDILMCFDVDSVTDMFAGSGTVGLACLELEKDCILIEKDAERFDNMQQTFKFLGVSA